MDAWAGFWIGLGIAIGLGIIGLGIEEFSCNIHSAVSDIIGHLQRNDPNCDE